MVTTRTDGLPPLEQLCLDHGIASELFTDARTAASQAMIRRNDADLYNRVQAFLGDAALPLPDDRPLFLLIRPIASADNELFRFLHLCEVVGAEPALITMHQDRFIHFNPDKLRRARLTFWDSEPSHHLRVGDLREADGSRMDQLRTRRGGSLIEYHARLLDAAGLDVACFDRSDWLRPNGRSDYLHFCALAMVGAVLVEAQDDDPDELEFWRREIRPGFQRAATLFGVPPLMTSHYAADEIDDDFWWGYPMDLVDDARRLLGDVRA